ncbi:hypothetical protein JCM8547_001975 [Rhodosporidiobolus lusitaniae]
MQATLFVPGPPDPHGNPTTQDRTVDLFLAGHGKKPREAVATVHLSPHALPSSFSPFGSSQPNEFATFVQGREAWLSPGDGGAEFREGVEEGFRRFAEESDGTEGYLLETTLTDGFSGLTPLVLEMLRDEFCGSKGAVWTTGFVKDAHGWAREDNERSHSQRLLNTLLSLSSLEETSSMLLPIQPSYAYDPHDPREKGWTRYFRPDLAAEQGEEGERARRQAMEAVRGVGLQGAGEELREPGVLPSLIEQLNWRGNTKIVHLSSAAPLCPAEFYQDNLMAGDKKGDGLRRLRGEWKDWSVGRAGEGGRRKPTTPYAQYSIVRGFPLVESQALGPLLEESVLPLKEPFSRWVSLEPPYPLSLASLPPIFSGLLPSGRPLTLQRPSLSDPLTSGGLFGLPDLRFPSASSYTVQPEELPVVSTLSTTPDVRYFLRSIVEGVKELRRTRAGVLREYEEGEYGVGREGVEEARERLESLIDAYGGEFDENEHENEEEVEGVTGGGLGGVGYGRDEDEDWSATEPREEEFDFDLE